MKIGSVFLLLVSVFWACSPAEAPPTGGEEEAGAEPLALAARQPFLEGLELSGPYRHENLELFLIHRSGEEPALPDYLTLADGLASGQVVLAEKKDAAEVGTLVISNDSDQPLFLQAGDIVKGGQQDRTLARDTVVAPRAQDVELAALCVERGRWQLRAGSGAVFGTDQKVLANAPSAAIKRKVLLGDQSGVWAEVENFQFNFNSNIGMAPNALESPTSLALNLENQTAVKAAREGIQRLEALAAGASDALGVAWAVGGEVRAVELYGSASLFRKARTSLITAAVYEAVAWIHEKGRPAVDSAAFASSLARTKATAEQREASAPGVERVVHQAEGALLVETLHAGRRIHMSYIPGKSGEEAGK